MTLHLYNQDTSHDESVILGDIQSLKALRDSIDKAIETGYSSSLQYAADGEGYISVIICREVDSQDRLPYKDNDYQMGPRHPLGAIPIKVYRKLFHEPDFK